MEKCAPEANPRPLFNFGNYSEIQPINAFNKLLM